MTDEKTTANDQNGDAAAKPARAGLSGLQVATSALAAASAAVVASFFGVGGTIIGAALASVTTTVSAALYGESLRRTGARLHRLRGQLPTGHPRAARPLPRSTVAAPHVRDREASADLPARRDPRRPPASRRGRWTRVAVSAAAVFGLAIALITTVELIGQRPVSALVGASSMRGTTTVGEIAGGDGTRSTGQGRTSPSPSPAAPSASDSSASTTPGSAHSEAPSTTPSRSTSVGTSSGAPSSGSTRDSTSAAPSAAHVTEPTPSPRTPTP